jgi:hypothetical protein
MFNRTPKPPTDDDIRNAGRALQQGGINGNGSSRLANKVVRQAERAGLDGDSVAADILDAAGNYPPRT